MTPPAADGAYPRLVHGRWVSSPLDHLAVYAKTGDDAWVAVPKSLLREASQFRECSARKTFAHDEDGPMKPMEAVCRRQNGHDDPRNLDYIRQHSNGYFTWATEGDTP